MSRAILRQLSTLHLVEVTINAIDTEPANHGPKPAAAVARVRKHLEACRAYLPKGLPDLAAPPSQKMTSLERQGRNAFDKLKEIFVTSLQDVQDGEWFPVWIRALDGLVCDVLGQMPANEPGRVNAWDSLDLSIVALFRLYADAPTEGWQRGQEVRRQLRAAAFNEWRLAA